jgi:hypothetical protein
VENTSGECAFLTYVKNQFGERSAKFRNGIFEMEFFFTKSQTEIGGRTKSKLADDVLHK